MKKRILAIILTLSLLFLCVPQIIFAADGDVTLNIENGDISITETGYKQANGSLIEHSGNYILTGTGSHKVSVSGTTCSITLKNLNMTDTNSYGLEIGNGSNITLIISGSNTITRGGYEGDSVPIGVMEGSSLTIKGETNDNGANVLNAIGTSDGKAAIGGSWDQYRCGDITILSGTVNATGGGNGSSVIGPGGNIISTSTITISGGIVNCTWYNTHKLTYMIGGNNTPVTVGKNATVSGTNLNLGGKLLFGIAGYTLKNTSTSLMQAIGDTLTLTTDVQDEKGESAEYDISYQWYTTFYDGANAVPISGATEKNYTIPADDATTIRNNYYKVIATYGDWSQELLITVLVSNTQYTVTIPEAATPNDSVTLSANAVLLRSVDKLNIKITATSGENNAFTLKSEEGAVLGYTLKNGDKAISLGESLLSLSSGESGETELSVIPDAAKYAGNYTGTVTFTVAVEEVNN